MAPSCSARLVIRTNIPEGLGCVAKMISEIFVRTGVHPTRASEFEASGDPERHLAQLLKLAQDGMETGHVVAIGECGLCVHALRVLGHPDTHSQFPAPEHAID